MSFASSSNSSSSGEIPPAAARASRAPDSHSSTASDCTGVLLVGGASTRFGSPKALARYRGQTFAELAWRKLGWCRERIAVGKTVDELPLPFPVLDDGAEERAPVFGIIAALEAAQHEVCIVLPVDCPLVPVGVLRALADAVAIPASGPLPGAYRKEMLPELERRVARGELSLRGVNDNVVSVPEELLVNVNRPAELARLSVTRAGIED